MAAIARPWLVFFAPPLVGVAADHHRTLVVNDIAHADMGAPAAFLILPFFFLLHYLIDFA
ncbi:MAG: hypothetical protein WD118_06745 [Phycisphaeraceae bacterium]